MLNVGKLLLEDYLPCVDCGLLVVGMGCGCKVHVVEQDTYMCLGATKPEGLNSLQCELGQDNMMVICQLACLCLAQPLGFEIWFGANWDALATWMMVHRPTRFFANQNFGVSYMLFATQMWLSFVELNMVFQLNFVMRAMKGGVW